MKTLMILLAITAVTYAGSTSVVINPHSPSYESSPAVNSALYVVAPVQQIDEDTLCFYPYSTDTMLTDTIWVSSKYSRRYFGAKWDDDDNFLWSKKCGRPIILSLAEEDGHHPDSCICLSNVNDSIWSNAIAWNKFRNGRGYQNAEFFQTRCNLGYGAWNYTDSSVSDMIMEYAKPVAGEYCRILFNGQLGQYHGSFNWKTAVGPQDEDARKRASFDCFGDSTYLPKRNSLYGIPEILIICDSLGTKPNFVYTRISDTTYCVASNFQAESIYVDPVTGADTFLVSVTRKSLAEDAAQFADYLFGDPDTGFAKLRQNWDSLDAVNTDRMLIGNDLMAAEYGLSPPSLFDYGAGWPNWNITKALIERGDVHPIDYDLIDDDGGWAILYRTMIRHEARLDCIAGAMKQVNPNLKVGAFIFADEPNHCHHHGYLIQPALAAEEIDHLGFHWYFTGGMDDFADNPVRLNYTTTDLDFMQDGHHEDSTKYVNHHLLNCALGDVGATELLKFLVEDGLPFHQDTAESIFGYYPPAKPLEITECNAHKHADIPEYDYNNYWAPQITVASALRYLGFLRTFNRLRADPDYRLEDAQQFHMNGGNSNWGFLWGYDDSSCAIWENLGYRGYNADGGNGWYTPAGGGFHAPWLANLLYHEIGDWGLDYVLNIDYDTITSIFLPQAEGDYDSVQWHFFCRKRRHEASSTFTPDSLFTMVTVDPYIGEYGVITTILVNRDTSEVATAVICTLAGNSRHYDSLIVYKLDIDSSEYAQANINHYNGI